MIHSPSPSSSPSTTPRPVVTNVAKAPVDKFNAQVIAINNALIKKREQQPQPQPQTQPEPQPQQQPQPQPQPIIDLSQYTEKDLAKIAKLLYPNKQLNTKILESLNLSLDEIPKHYKNFSEFIKFVQSAQQAKEISTTLDFHSVNTFDKIFSKFITEDKNKSINNLRKLFESTNILITDDKLKEIYDKFKNKKGKYYDYIVDANYQESINNSDSNSKKEFTKLVKYYLSDKDRLDKLKSILDGDVSKFDFNKIKSTFYEKNELDMNKFEKAMKT